MSKKYMHIYKPMGDGSMVIHYEKVEVEKCPSLDELQEIVGGLIELVKVSFESAPGAGYEMCDMIINEDGLGLGLAVNITATRLMAETYPEVPAYIVGPAIVFEGFELP
jgi:hypothetical protein